MVQIKVPPVFENLYFLVLPRIQLAFQECRGLSPEALRGDRLRKQADSIPEEFLVDLATFVAEAMRCCPTSKFREEPHF